MGTETIKGDEVGRVEGMGLVYISSGGRSAISSSCLAAEGAGVLHRQERERERERLEPARAHQSTCSLVPSLPRSTSEAHPPSLSFHVRF